LTAQSHARFLPQSSAPARETQRLRRFIEKIRDAFFAFHGCMRRLRGYRAKYQDFRGWEAEIGELCVSCIGG